MEQDILQGRSRRGAVPSLREAAGKTGMVGGRLVDALDAAQTALAGNYVGLPFRLIFFWTARILRSYRHMNALDHERAGCPRSGRA